MSPTEREHRQDEDEPQADSAGTSSEEASGIPAEYVFKILPADPKQNSTDFEDVADK
jgi:hypothetical protein